MEDGDIIMFKLADSAEQVAARKFAKPSISAEGLTGEVSPHAAFMDPSVPKDTPERASVEVRVIVIG
jgi:hypothetical protein